MILVLVEGASFAGVSASFEISVKIFCCTLGCVAISSSAVVCAFFVSCSGVFGFTLGDVRISVGFICASLFVRAALARMVSSRCRASISSLHMFLGF